MSVYDRVSLAHCFDEAAALRVAARAAEDAGDFQGALRLVRRLPEEVATSCWRRQLVRAVELPLTGAQLSRWLVHPALRWALERPAGQLIEAHAHLMLATLGVSAVVRERRLATVVARDPVVIDAGLFDGGFFAQYLTAALDSSLLARAGPVTEWSAWPASVWELARQLPGRAVLRDCVTGSEVTCLPTKESIEEPDGVLLYGRLVPVTGEVCLAFALTPEVVDRRCAARVVRARQRGAGPDERIRAVAHSRKRRQAADDRA